MPKLPRIRPVPLKVQDVVALDALLDRLRGEFRAMPGLALTLPQAARLFGVPEEACVGILRRLVDAGLLCVRSDGRYALRGQAA